MLKAAIRKEYKERRLGLSSKEALVSQDLLMIQFQTLDLPFLNLIHTYLPLYDRNEPDPIPLVDWLRFGNPGMKVAVSKIVPEDVQMIHLLQDEETRYKENAYGIPEPVSGQEIQPNEMDLIFVPLLAFDSLGNRVGYGKGYYDRFIAKTRKDALKIGLSYFSAVDSIDDIGIFDKKLDFCITPDRVYAF
ncbi:MAG: hypothetical protein RL131_916 [Bacteroidota bacterium]